MRIDGFAFDKLYSAVCKFYYAVDKFYFAVCKIYFLFDKFYFAVDKNYFPFDKDIYINGLAVFVEIDEKVWNICPF